MMSGSSVTNFMGICETRGSGGARSSITCVVDSSSGGNTSTGSTGATGRETTTSGSCTSNGTSADGNSTLAISIGASIPGLLTTRVCVYHTPPETSATSTTPAIAVLR